MSPGSRALVRFLQPAARFLAERRRITAGVTATLFVPAVVLLVFDSLVPFPRPGERPLYDPHGWSLGRAAAPPAAGREPAVCTAGALGGSSTRLPRFATMVWTVRPGETILGIAEQLGMNADTISSINRPGGRGVHTLAVGERIRIPNQDGVSLSVDGNLDSLAKRYDVDPDEVLEANGMTRVELRGTVNLFFPGVRLQGYDRLLALGMAVANPLAIGWQSSPFGRRPDPFTGEMSRHQGIDIAAPAGSSVRSASDGVVTAVGYNDVLGNYVIVRDPRPFFLVYGHMETVLVKQGSRVATGERIGLVGSTGKATGPHLHFEVRNKFGVPENPRWYMK